MIVIILIHKIMSYHSVIINLTKILHKIIFSKVMGSIYHKTERVIKKILLKMMILKMAYNV
jgi:hypothetical protein